MEFDVTLLMGQLFNGLVWGIVLGLLAVGLTIIFGMLDVVNFAHGAMYMVGAYAAFSFTLALTHLFGTSTGSFWIALFLAPIVVGLLGMIIEFFLLRRMSGQDVTYQLLLTFGLALIIQELVIIIWGSMPMSFPTPKILRGVVDLGFIFYPKYRLFILIVTPLIMLAIWLFLEKTKYGSIIRAGTEDKEMANLLGINIRRVFTMIFSFGAAMAGLTGVLAGPVIGSLQPDLGTSVLLGSFVVVVVGGMGSFGGAILGAVLVGLTKGITTMIWPPASNVIMFVLMALILVVRPQGLLGKR
jgi:branched-chain amino acid transport system permease protein